MKVSLIKEILNEIGDIRLLTRDINEITITDLFINGDDDLRIEQYSSFTIEDIIENSEEKELNEEAIENLCNWLKLWTLNETNNNTPDNDDFDCDWIMDGISIESLKKLTPINYEQCVLNFLNKNKERELFVCKR